MSDDEAAKKAIAELDNGTVDGRTIKVMEAKPREDRPARSNNFRNDNSGGGFKKSRW
jgi:RNA recognition motif-containing protein